MSNEASMEVDRARAVLRAADKTRAAEAKERVKLCQDGVNALLEKFGCAFRAVPGFKPTAEGGDWVVSIDLSVVAVDKRKDNGS